MVDLSAKFNVTLKKMSDFHAQTSKLYDIESSLLKLEEATEGNILDQNSITGLLINVLIFLVLSFVLFIASAIIRELKAQKHATHSGGNIELQNCAPPPRSSDNPAVYAGETVDPSQVNKQN